MASILTPFGNAVRAVERRVDQFAVDRAQARTDRAKVDDGISYPSYKSMDAYIDVERLKGLDGYLRDRLSGRLNDNKFWTGELTMERKAEREPGSRELMLMRNTRDGPRNYFDLNKTELWVESEESKEFPELMEFIKTLPFKTFGRALIMYDFNCKPVTAHRDHCVTDELHEFIWFRPNLTKPLFMMDKHRTEKKMVQSYSAWFDTVNQFHGADAAEGFSVSLRVDGIFSDELRALIPSPQRNRASTPSLWQARGDNAV